MVAVIQLTCNFLMAVSLVLSVPNYESNDEDTTGETTHQEPQDKENIGS